MASSPPKAAITGASWPRAPRSCGRLLRLMIASVLRQSPYAAGRGDDDIVRRSSGMSAGTASWASRPLYVLSSLATTCWICSSPKLRERATSARARESGAPIVAATSSASVRSWPLRCGASGVSAPARQAGAGSARTAASASLTTWCAIAAADHGIAGKRRCEPRRGALVIMRGCLGQHGPVRLQARHARGVAGAHRHPPPGCGDRAPG
jgi:hypothetical protein